MVPACFQIFRLLVKVGATEAGAVTSCSAAGCLLAALSPLHLHLLGYLCLSCFFSLCCLSPMPSPDEILSAAVTAGVLYANTGRKQQVDGRAAVEPAGRACSRLQRSILNKAA
jgi:sorbitol-specific phosphotransferase system component IIBC